MRDYRGDMSYFQDQLTAKGISKERLNMSRYCGLTERELQYIVDNAEFFAKPADVTESEGV